MLAESLERPTGALDQLESRVGTLLRLSPWSGGSRLQECRPPSVHTNDHAYEQFLFI